MRPSSICTTGPGTAFIPPAGSNPEPLAVNVDCSQTLFTYQSGSTERAGLLSLMLRITFEGESFQLLQQVHVDNAP